MFVRQSCAYSTCTNVLHTLTHTDHVAVVVQHCVSSFVDCHCICIEHFNFQFFRNKNCILFSRKHPIAFRSVDRKIWYFLYLWKKYTMHIALCTVHGKLGGYFCIRSHPNLFNCNVFRSWSNRVYIFCNASNFFIWFLNECDMEAFFFWIDECIFGIEHFIYFHFK